VRLIWEGKQACTWVHTTRRRTSL